MIGLRVADSKGIVFLRDSERLRVFYRPPRPVASLRGDGIDRVEAVLRQMHTAPSATALSGYGYKELTPAHLIYVVNSPEADNPYGTSILRSLEFVSQILLKMQNATGRVWERFGDPPFHIKYSTKNRKVDEKTTMKRATAIAANLAKAMLAKARGNSVDLATGVGADDDIAIDVIGAAAEALTIEMPAKHMLEQVCAKELNRPQVTRPPVYQRSSCPCRSSRTRCTTRSPIGSRSIPSGSLPSLFATASNTRPNPAQGH